MKQWIREHPWRLDIVPFLMIVLAAVLPFTYRQQYIANHGNHWVGNYVVGLAILVIYMIAGIVWNHKWGTNEHEKRFNPYIPLYGPGMALFASMDLTNHHNYPAWAVYVWITAGILSVPIESYLEYTRRFIPKPELLKQQIASGIDDIKSGESFYYRESNTRWAVLFWILIQTIISIALVWVIFRKMLAIPVGVVNVTILALLAMGILQTFRCCSSFVVTNEHLRARIGLVSVSIPLSSIISCSTRAYNALADFGGYGVRTGVKDYKGVVAYIPKPGSLGLFVETNDGSKYLFGMKSPETACKLISTAIAAYQRWYP